MQVSRGMCVWIEGRDTVRVLGDKMPMFRFKGGLNDTYCADFRRYRERCRSISEDLILGCELASVRGIRYRILVRFRWAVEECGLRNGVVLHEEEDGHLRSFNVGS